MPEFKIDLSVPIEKRYTQVFEAFKDQILKVEKLFIDQLAQQDVGFEAYIKENLDQFKVKQPEVF